MMRLALLTLAAAVVAGGGSARGDDMKSPLATLVAAERSFAKMATDTTVRDAFVANFATDAIVMRPGPVDAQTWFASRPQWGVKELITWDPSIAGVAAAGDIGYTAGPWQYRPTHDLATKPVANGYFFTVWIATATGWKVKFDHGVGTPEPATAIAPFDAATAKAPASPAKTDASAASAALETAEAALVRDVSTDAGKAYGAALADDACLFRPDVLPAVGKADAVGLAAGTAPKGVVFTRAALGVSSSADLAYVFGSVAFATPPEKAVPGAYLHVWRRGADGAWRLALDVLDPPAVAQ